mmetsp:Transcript_42065/g.48411  ORF Transcript_42065/g.48411 Transcript_42065/m.48411 type:complete len:258 (+) Transcript_42065:43-816(+)
MEDIKDQEDDINRDIAKVEQKIQSMAKMQPSLKTKVVGECRTLTKRVKKLLEGYQLEMNNLSDPTEFNICKNRYNEMTKNLEDLNTELNWQASADNAGEDLYGGTRVEKNTAEMNQQELIQHGDKLADTGLDSLQKTKQLVAQSNEVGQSIQEELNRHTEVIRQIEEGIQDVESNIKRAQKLVRYFARTVKTDKYLLCILGIIVLAVFVILIYASVEGDSPFNAPDDTVPDDVKNNDQAQKTRLLMETFLGVPPDNQ